MSKEEVWKLHCWSCNQELELPDRDPSQPETLTCPHCGAELIIEFRPEAA